MSLKTSICCHSLSTIPVNSPLYQESVLRFERPATTPYQIKRVAEEMSVPFKAAVMMRLRFISDMMAYWEEMKGKIHEIICDSHIKFLFAEKEDLERSIVETPRLNNITQDMIDQANAYPIDKLQEFTNGKCRCPFHDDQSPSMFHATKKNIAYCPVCAEGWGSIRLLMKRDNYSFQDAIKTLTR